MSKFGIAGVLGILLASFSAAQTTTVQNGSVNGRYFFRQLQFSTDTLGKITGSAASLGSLNFDGAGRFTVDAFQTVGNLPATPLTGTGTYTVQSSGMMTISNPQRNGLTINARLGTEMILGSTTESGDNTFDLFAAILAPAEGQGNSLFQGTYSVSSFELQSGLAAGARSALFNLPVALGGVVGVFRATGHAANLQNGVLFTETVGGASYAMGADGIGTISLSGTSPLLSGTRNLYVSRSGNVVLAGSPYAGGQDFLIGVRQFVGSPALSNLSGLYWTGGLRLDTKNLSTEAYAGSLNGLPSLAQAVTTDRLHQFGTSPEDATLANAISVNSDGNFAYGLDVLSLGKNGDSFVATGLSAVDPGGYSIDIGIRAPALTGTGVFVNPQGILNAANLAPAGAAISPGELVSLFGTGLANTAVTGTPPYSQTLGEVSLTVNGLPAPIAYVSSGQINFLVPYAASGATASIVVTSGTSISNTVAVPLQKTSPGAFSTGGAGTGLGAITHSNGSLVTATNPAARGETVVVYATGLGVVTPDAVDGVASSGTTVSPVAVAIAGQPSKVTFAGLSPSFPGLYQINVLIPANLAGSGALPLAIQTIDAFHDQVDLQVQ